MSFGDMTEGRTMRERLREKFPKEQIGKLPASNKRPALDYVGHAAVTDRLNRYAPDWTYTVDKLFNSGDATWIEGTMTIGGVSRVEYGDGKTPKEAVSDFVKRGAMRFGVALDLWSKEELESSAAATSQRAPSGDAPVRAAAEPTSPAASPAAPQGDSAGHEPEADASPGAVAAGGSSGGEPKSLGEGGDGSPSDSTSATHDHIEHRPRDCGPWSETTPDGKLLVKGYVACQLCGHVVPKTEARVA